MALDQDGPRDWHRLFGLLLTDFFTDSPFRVEVERDLSRQQQLLDVVILRRGRGKMVVRLPDGLDRLAAHNLITFKSHREALDDWAMKELIGHYVAYRKLVSMSPSDLLPEDQFRLYAVCARFPNNLVDRIPWQERQAGVYDCLWGTDIVTAEGTSGGTVRGENPEIPQRVEHQPPRQTTTQTAPEEVTGIGEAAVLFTTIHAPQWSEPAPFVQIDNSGVVQRRVARVASFL